MIQKTRFYPRRVFLCLLKPSLCFVVLTLPSPLGAFFLKFLMRPRVKTDLIIIHCSATRANQAVNTDDIRRWHVNDNGWDDIGYHLVIERDGSLHIGRPIDVIGAHCRGVNHTSVGVCLVGGCDDRMQPEDNFTDEQYFMLRLVVDGLQQRYPGSDVKGHRDFDNKKACPSFDVGQWLDKD